MNGKLNRKTGRHRQTSRQNRQIDREIYIYSYKIKINQITILDMNSIL